MFKQEKHLRRILPGLLAVSALAGCSKTPVSWDDEIACNTPFLKANLYERVTTVTAEIQALEKQFASGATGKTYWYRDTTDHGLGSCHREECNSARCNWRVQTYRQQDGQWAVDNSYTFTPRDRR